MKVIVIGGDGFCGWPTSLHLLGAGYEVLIIDNLSRRKIDHDLGTKSLTKIADIDARVKTANRVFGPLKFVHCDTATQVDLLRKTISDFAPDHIVMFGEQRAAPYSMIDDNTRRYTIDNNVTSTHNVCSAVVDIDPTIHLVHLGTMGVYGYSDVFGTIPEGYLDITVDSTQKQTQILYPANPGSVYHLTKCLDQLIFQYYNKNWKVRVTDLHQGIVWGVNTEETLHHRDLVNRFDYDGIYGTVLNRFIVQSIAGQDLTVYGSGGQKRAFINIRDTVACIRLAIESAEKVDDKRVRIMNQIAEVHSVKDLAHLIASKTGAKVSHVVNPRNELPENELSVSNSNFLELGFKPTMLEESLLDDILSLATTNSARYDARTNLTSPQWTPC